MLIAGPGGAVADVIVKTDPFDTVPPPFTVTVAVPCEAMRLAATVAVNWLALTKVVGNGDPLQRTVEPAVNPAPFTVRLNCGPPACAVDGLSVVTAGPVGVTPFRIASR